MRRLLEIWIWLAPVFIACHAQDRCTAADLSHRADHVLALQAGIERIPVAERQDVVPPAITDGMNRLKDVLMSPD